MAAFHCKEKALLRSAVVAASICAGMALPSVAQQSSLRGRVQDPSGEALYGTDVTVRRGDQTISKMKSNPEGAFSFIADPGRYCVSVAWSGSRELGPTCTDFNSSEIAQVTMSAMIVDWVEVQPNPAAVTAVDPVGSVPNAAVPPIPPVDIASNGKWNFGALVQGGFGVTEDRGGFKFFLIGGHAGRVLTPQLGSGILKGDFEYGVEVFPLWQSYTPKFQRANCQQINPPTPTSPPGTYVACSAEFTVGGTFTGVSVTPAIFRWNFTHGQRWMPWIQGAGGLIWTNHKYPAFGEPLPAPGPITIGPPLGQYYLDNDGPGANTSVWNFTPQFGVGTLYFVRSKRSIDVSANAVHISSASLGDKNPGVNASVQFSVGYSWWK
jgi:lipid A 3-O-deacylase